MNQPIDGEVENDTANPVADWRKGVNGGRESTIAWCTGAGYTSTTCTRQALGVQVCRSQARGCREAHQVIPTGNGQGERGVAAPQHVWIRSVREKEPDYVSGTLWEEKQKHTKSEGPLHTSNNTIATFKVKPVAQLLAPCTSTT